MPVRTLGLETLRARPGRNRRKIYGDLTNIEGADVLHLFHGFFRDLDPDLLVNKQTGYYTRIERVIPDGRSVVVVAESGYFGERGQTIDVTTHKTTHSRTPDMSPTVLTRLALTVPPGGTTAVFGIERAARSAAGPKLIEMFRHALTAKFNSFAWTTETVIESVAWLAASDLEEVRAVAYAVPTDISKGLVAQRRVLGRVEHTYLPPKDAKTFPKWFWELLRSGSVEASEFLGFEGRDVDETTVVVSRNGQHKRFNIQREKTPAIRVQLTDRREDPLTDTEFLRRCQDEVRDYFDGMGLTWQEAWRAGGWSPNALKVTLPPH